MSSQSTRNTPALQIRNLNVHYGASHALQGVNLTLDHGIISVVGRNGMGKTTLCMAIMGLVPVTSGSIQFKGHELVGMQPAEIARLGIGYVPQGRRLWPSLTVDEHLKMLAGSHAGPWNIERLYSTFPRLAERKNNGGGQLSGGEQQMLAIARALLLNPKLLVMDEPTEGLAPVIVTQIEEMLLHLQDESDVDVLLIEQNIGVATIVSENVAIMVNGEINRIIAAGQLAGDRELQQTLLGVGRHADEADSFSARQVTHDETSNSSSVQSDSLIKIYLSNPKPPTRWSKSAPVQTIINSARTVSDTPSGMSGSSSGSQLELRPLSRGGRSVVLVAGTLDTKGNELRYIRDILKSRGLSVQLVDLATTGKYSGADVPANQIAAYHPGGVSQVISGDRGKSVAGMAIAFENWAKRQTNIAGIIGAGGSGGTAIITAAMRALPFGIPKVMISTIASGDVGQYVGPADIMMFHSVADVQGLNSITKSILSNGANALWGMVSKRSETDSKISTGDARASVGLTMFGVTTACVEQITGLLKDNYDCLVFHATGIGGQAMESLIDNGMISGVLDITTTEVCDLLMGGVFPASEDRFGAMIRKRMPYVGSCGALDMVNFGAPDSVPEKYRDRKFYEHNPQVTLMRTTVEENAAIGRWIGEKLNLMDAPVRFYLPEGGVSSLDAPGMPFHDPQADAALFNALEQTVRQTSQRQLIRSAHNINDPEFVAEIVEAFRSVNVGNSKTRRRAR